MYRVYNESFRLRCPDFGDVFAGREAAGGLEPPDIFLGCHEVRGVRAQLAVAVVVIPFDGSVLDPAVHPLCLAVGLGVVGFRQPMPDPERLHSSWHTPYRGHRLTPSEETRKHDLTPTCATQP